MCNNGSAANQSEMAPPRFPPAVTIALAVALFGCLPFVLVIAGVAFGFAGCPIVAALLVYAAWWTCLVWVVTGPFGVALCWEAGRILHESGRNCRGAAALEWARWLCLAQCAFITAGAVALGLANI